MIMLTFGTKRGNCRIEKYFCAQGAQQFCFACYLLFVNKQEAWAIAFIARSSAIHISGFFFTSFRLIKEPLIECARSLGGGWSSKCLGEGSLVHECALRSQKGSVNCQNFIPNSEKILIWMLDALQCLFRSIFILKN